MGWGEAQGVHTYVDTGGPTGSTVVKSSSQQHPDCVFCLLCSALVRMLDRPVDATSQSCKQYVSPVLRIGSDWGMELRTGLRSRSIGRSRPDVTTTVGMMGCVGEFSKYSIALYCTLQRIIVCDVWSSFASGAIPGCPLYLDPFKNRLWDFLGRNRQERNRESATPPTSWWGVFVT